MKRNHRKAYIKAYNRRRPEPTPLWVRAHVCIVEFAGKTRHWVLSQNTKTGALHSRYY